MDTINPGRDQVVRVTVACGVLATVAVVLRLVARRRSKAVFAADDWWMIASLIPSYGMLAAGSIMITSGRGGQHADTLTKSQMATFLKTLDASIITYTLTITMVKISILLLYRRIFHTLSFKRATLIVGITCVSWLLASLLCLAFQCHTFSERYDVDSLFSDQCIDLKAYWVAVTGSNMALDVIMLCMPLYMVWNLKLATRQKIWLSGIFALGTLVCIAGLMRIISIDLVKGADLSYTIIKCYMWSQIEPTMATVCACLTTLRPLFSSVKLPSLSFLSWTSKHATSNFPAKNQGRWSELWIGSENGQEKENKRIRSLSERRQSDMELVGFEQVVNAGKQEGTSLTERSETSTGWITWHEDTMSSLPSMKREDSPV